MEIFEAIIKGQFALIVEAYMQATADEDLELPFVGVEVDLEMGLNVAFMDEVGKEEKVQMAAQQVYQVLYDIGFTEDQLSQEIHITPLGLICLLLPPTEVKEALLWHQVYYKLGLVRDMAVVSVGDGDETDELQSVDAILRARGLEVLADLQYSIYNNLPPF